MSRLWGSAILVSGLLLGAATPATVQAQSGGKFCEVTIDREYADNTFYVTRQTLANGDCVCYVQTGPKPQTAETEDKIVALRREQRCDNADATIAVPADHAVAPAAGGGIGAGKFALLAALAGAVVVVASDSDSDSPASP